jgi:hypothetical protein
MPSSSVKTAGGARSFAYRAPLSPLDVALIVDNSQADHDELVFLREV